MGSRSSLARFRTWLRTPVRVPVLDDWLVRFWRPQPGANVQGLEGDFGPGLEAEQDDRLSNRGWLALAEECVALYDELIRHRSSFDPARQELIDHVCLRLQEILERSGVDTIVVQGGFNRRLHQEAGEHSGASQDSRIIEVASPGFAVGPRVLRRAHVRLAGPDGVNSETVPHDR